MTKKTIILTLMLFISTTTYASDEAATQASAPPAETVIVTATKISDLATTCYAMLPAQAKTLADKALEYDARYNFVKRLTPYSPLITYYVSSILGYDFSGLAGACALVYYLNLQPTDRTVKID